MNKVIIIAGPEQEKLRRTTHSVIANFKKVDEIHIVELNEKPILKKLTDLAIRSVSDLKKVVYHNQWRDKWLAIMGLIEKWDNEDNFLILNEGSEILANSSFDSHLNSKPNHLIVNGVAYTKQEVLTTYKKKELKFKACADTLFNFLPREVKSYNPFFHEVSLSSFIINKKRFDQTMEELEVIDDLSFYFHYQLQFEFLVKSLNPNIYVEENLFIHEEHSDHYNKLLDKDISFRNPYVKSIYILLVRNQVVMNKNFYESFKEASLDKRSKPTASVAAYLKRIDDLIIKLNLS